MSRDKPIQKPRLPTLTFGRHKGKPITQVPVGYLRWMANEFAGRPEGDMAEQELQRRGTIALPSLEVSGHAIDRASQRLLEIWHKNRCDGDGLYTWLVKASEKALEEGQVDTRNPGIIYYGGIKFVFEVEHRWPVLKTVAEDIKSN